jgi:hypothetical protein
MANETITRSRGELGLVKAMFEASDGDRKEEW